MDVKHQARLVGMAVLAQHPTVKLDAYRLLQGGNALVQLRSVLGSISVLRGSLYRDFCALLLLHGQVLNSVVKDLPQCL